MTRESEDRDRSTFLEDLASLWRRPVRAVRAKWNRSLPLSRGRRRPPANGQRLQPAHDGSASLYFEARKFLHGLFVGEDKLSMAHSPETRVPFLVNDLVDFAMRWPVVLKLNNLSDVLRMNESEPGDERGKYFLKTARIYEFLDRRTAKALVNEHLAGKRNGRLRIWSLLSLEQLLVEHAPT